MTRLLAAAAASCFLLITAAAQAAPELSTSDRLQDRRFVAASPRAYGVGFEDGYFYAHGWHITGEMGGVWTPPLKLLDGVWFGVDGDWIGPATRFTSGWGYARMDFADTAGLRVRRSDFAPDGRRAVLYGLELTNPGAAERTATVMVDAHSELLQSYPWSFADVMPNASDQPPDTGAFRNGRLVFRDDGNPWSAVVGAREAPSGGEAGDGPHRGDQGNHVCPADDSTSPPSACDDGPYGKGAGGQLRYAVTIPAGGSRTLWVGVAGSENGQQAAASELDAALADPDAALAAKVQRRERIGRRTRLSLPSDPLLQQAVEWGKQNLEDQTLVARDLDIRYVDQGKQYPPGTPLARARWIGAGFPDYPWIFATDAEYTAFANVTVGQFGPIKDHMRALKAISEIVNGNSGKVAHEITFDGAVWYGALKDEGNTDETAKFPSTVALIWRWTGDDAFRDEMYGFARRNLRYIDRELDEDGDGWPEGLGNVERAGMGPEKLDNTVYYIRGLYDLADLARSKADGATYAWARNRARDLQRRFEGAWWMDGQSLHADSLGEDNEQIQQKHWITSTPMEAELTVKQRAVPGLTTFDHGNRSLATHEVSWPLPNCFSGERPYNRGLFHTGCGGGPEGNGELSIFSLGTGIQAVGEGNYGRLGPERQQRYTDANAETMFSEPATGGEPDEQPGAMPEIFPSPGFDPEGDRDKNIDRCWTCRAMFMQAWGNYGTMWPAVHQQLGVRPDLGRERLEVVPQLPSAAPIAGEQIRLGSGALDVVRASREGNRFRTFVDTGSAPIDRLRIGHTLPRGSQVVAVFLDGRRKGRGHRRLTNRGLEVTVKTKPGEHTLEVVAAG